MYFFQDSVCVSVLKTLHLRFLNDGDSMVYVTIFILVIAYVGL